MRRNAAAKSRVSAAQADAVALRNCGDSLYRFCQQCGKLQPLVEFKGKNR
jgi:hypothetical protein